jgi:hypothetical protein
MENNHETMSQPEKIAIEPINLLERLQAGEDFSAIMKELPEAAFAPKKKCACCSDGRFEPSDPMMEKSGLAGQGILLLFSPSEREAFINNLKSRNDRPEAIASHVGCGAAGLAFKELQKMIAEGKSVDEIFSWLGISALPETSDQLGEIFTKRLASEVGSDYYHMADFIPGKENHNESGIIVSAIDFDERFVKVGDQQFFNSSSAQYGVSDEYLRTELTKLAEIAFHHGKMEHDLESPFYLLLLGNRGNIDRLMKAAALVASDPQFAGRIKVESSVRA